MPSHVNIIAEAGVNHNGDVSVALKMIQIAAESGADSIKFQTFRAENLVIKDAVKAPYQLNQTSQDETQYDMLKKLELNYDDHLELKKFSEQNGIEFISSPFDIESIDLLSSIGIKTIKIPSGEITNAPYLKKLGKLGKNIILSTGMATIEEVGNALDLLIRSGQDKKLITLLHATTEYPAPYDEVNLRAMLTLKDTFDIQVGYSDHTKGIEIPIAAAAMGANVIEKHFTLSRDMKGPDHKASLEPDELRQMILCIRNIEKSLGDGIKKPSPSEIHNIDIVRKSVYYSRFLNKDHVLTENDLIMKRPGDGISPMEADKILNRRLNRDVFPDTKVIWEDIQ